VRPPDARCWRQENIVKKDIAWDVIIAGAGPAGLSAALVLGRACRRVLICDKGTPRSWAAKHMHAYLSREGMSPDEFRALGRREILRHPGVRFLSAEVASARRASETHFEVRVGRRRFRGRKLLIATGVLDLLPDIPGFGALFGHSIFQCPYCDGWEMRGRRVAVYGRRRRGFEMARAMTAWTRSIELCTDGPAGYSDEERRHLAANDIRLHEGRIVRVEGNKGQIQAVVLRDGTRVECAALFFDTPSTGQSRLAESLGCRFARHGGVLCGQYEATSVPGVYVAGNVIRDVQLSIVAAAEGARAAFGINRALTREDFERRATGARRVEHPRVSE
jgi:thioredoxin reductase